MKARPLQFVAKHKMPFLIGGGVIVLFLVYKNMSGASTTTSAPTAAPADPTAEQIALLQAQGSVQSQLAGLQGQIQTTQQVNSINGQIQLANIQAANATQQTAAQLSLGEAQTAASVALANISAQQNVGIAQIQGQTMQDIAGYNAQVGIAQANGIGAAMQSMASGQEAQAIGGAVSSVLSSASMFF
jgi:hypothetical protein